MAKAEILIGLLSAVVGGLITAGSDYLIKTKELESQQQQIKSDIDVKTREFNETLDLQKWQLESAEVELRKLTGLNILIENSINPKNNEGLRELIHAIT
jgi:hypothetical protein